jgi:hypothetical protein
MTDLIYDYITMGVDMMISAAILASVIILLKSSTVLSNVAASQQATSDKLNYYREYSMYDNTSTLMSPDALSTITYYRYDLDIVIVLKSGTISNDKKTGKYYYQPNSGSKTEVKYDTGTNNLVSLLKSDMVFNSVLFENYTTTPSSSGYQGGVISGIKMTQR